MTPQVVLLFSVLVVVAIAQQDSRVVVLNQDNFDSLTSKGKWLVEFYAPWCGHCKRLNPILDAASLQLAEEGIDFNIGKVDCTVESQLANRFDIRAYPTVKYMRSKLSTPYEGARSLEAIVDFAKRVSRPPVEEVNDENELNALREDYKVIFVLVGGSENAKDSFKQVADKLHDSIAFASVGKEMKSFFEKAPNSDYFIAVASDDTPQYFTGPFTEDAITEWVKQNQFPLVAEIGPQNYNALISNGKLTVIVAVDPKDSKTTKFLDTLRKVARNFREKFSFGYINGVEKEQLVSNYGVSTLPGIYVLEHSTKVYYKSTIEGELNEMNVKAYLNEILEGKITSERAGGFLGVMQDNGGWIVVLLGVVMVFGMFTVVFCVLSGPEEPKKD